MYKVLITTTVVTNNGCHASSIILDIHNKYDAEDAVEYAKENTDYTIGLTVRAVILNPDAR